MTSAATSSRAAELPVIHDGESAPAKAWRRAMEAGDLATIASMYGPSSVVFPPDAAEQKGTAAIVAGYRALFVRFTVDVDVRDAHWLEQPPLVVSWGMTTLTLHPKAGGPDQMSRTRFTDAAVASRDGWRYIVDHASVVPAAK